MTAKKKEVTPEVSKPEAEEETIPGTQSTARLSIWIAVVIISIALIGYLTSRGSFKAEDVAEGISATSQDIAAYMEESGFEGEFSYESLSLQGSVFSRVAVVKAPKFVLRNASTGDEIQITTDDVTIHPKSAEMNEFVLVFDKSVTVGKDGAEYKIIQKLPVKIAISREASVDRKALEYAMNYPEGMGFIVQVSGLDEATGDSSYQFNVGVGSSVKGVLDLKERSYYEASELKDVAVEFSQSIAKLAGLKMVFEEAGHDGSRFRHYKLDGETLTFVGPYQGIGKVDVAMEVEEELAKDAASESQNLTLTNLNIKGEDFAVSGEGQMELRQDEILPYGTLGTEVTSLSVLLERLGKVGVLPEGSSPLVAGLLQRAATPTQEENVVQIQFQRAPGGAFMIGSQTFEELAVSLLRDMVRGVKSDPVIVAPDAVAPTEDSAGQPEEEEEIAPVEGMPDTTPESDETPSGEGNGSSAQEDDAAQPEESSPVTEDAAQDELRKAHEALEQLKQKIAPTDTESPAYQPETIAPPSDEIAPLTEAPKAEKKTDE